MDVWIKVEKYCYKCFVEHSVANVIRIIQDFSMLESPIEKFVGNLNQVYGNKNYLLHWLGLQFEMRACAYVYIHGLVLWHHSMWIYLNIMLPLSYRLMIARDCNRAIGYALIYSNPIYIYLNLDKTCGQTSQPKSLTYIKNSVGHKTDPRSTPLVTLIVVE